RPRQQVVRPDRGKSAAEAAEGGAHAAIDEGIHAHVPCTARFSAKWHATARPSALAISGGSVVAQTACALKQRVRKRQPEGGAAGLGTSPRSTMRRRARSRRGSGIGTADSSACV